jgi:hypothetical protein
MPEVMCIAHEFENKHDHRASLTSSSASGLYKNGQLPGSIPEPVTYIGSHGHSILLLHSV